MHQLSEQDFLPCMAFSLPVDVDPTTTVSAVSAESITLPENFDDFSLDLSFDSDSVNTDILEKRVRFDLHHAAKYH